jgi:hypothetical protein
MKSRIVFLLGLFLIGSTSFLAAQTIGSATVVPEIMVPSGKDAAEVERLLSAVLSMPFERRIPLISRYLLGRKYHPETKKRIKKQQGTPKPKKTAANLLPLPVNSLKTDLTYLDCMTYVEHVLALANCDKPSYTGAFLPRLTDIMFNARGRPLMSHLRNHFTSVWGDVNERKGYFINVARGHPLAATRDVVLNQVGDNQTFYVEDRFMISSASQRVHYFPVAVVLSGKAPLSSGDVLALVCGKEGLDVTHMAFFIEADGRKIFRHASMTNNRVMDEDFLGYLRTKKELKGLMVFRPRGGTPPAFAYRYRIKPTPRKRASQKRLPKVAPRPGNIPEK